MRRPLSTETKDHKIVADHQIQNEMMSGNKTIPAIRDELNMIDGVAIKDKRVTIPHKLQQPITELLHINHMVIEMPRVLARVSIIGQPE